MKDAGLIAVKSSHSVKATADKLEALLNEKGMAVFNRIDHRAGAKKAGVDLRPTELLLFGNPKVGAPLMASNQTAGIDLPQKMLVWEDEQGGVWLTYNNPEYLKERHNIAGNDPLFDKINTVLGNFASAAAA